MAPSTRSGGQKPRNPGSSKGEKNKKKGINKGIKKKAVKVEADEGENSGPSPKKVTTNSGSTPCDKKPSSEMTNDERAAELNGSEGKKSDNEGEEKDAQDKENDVGGDDNGTEGEANDDQHDSENPTSSTGKRNPPDYQIIKRRILFGHYPEGLSSNQKANLRRMCEPYCIIKDDLWWIKTVRHKRGEVRERPQDLHLWPLQQLYDEGYRKVVMTPEERRQVMKSIHEGLGDTPESKSLAAHHGRDNSQLLLGARYHWYGMSDDMRDYCASCEIFQKVNPSSSKVIPALRPVGMPARVMAQIGIDIMELPQVDGKRYVYVAIDYFSKWTETRAAEDKTARSVAAFIYDDIICRHGCPKIQINDQGREFVNQLAEELHSLTGTKQRITSAYHPQANGLVERQNQTIKKKLLKVLQENIDQWPRILPGVLFAHRSVRHRSTKHSPFYVMYLRSAILPIDVASAAEFSEDDMLLTTDGEYDAFDSCDYERICQSMINLRGIINKEVKANIDEAQKKQKEDFDRRKATKLVFKVGDRVFLEPPSKGTRKGDKLVLPTGPYVITEIKDESRARLKSEASGKELATMYNFKHLRLITAASRPVNQQDKESEVDEEITSVQIIHFKYRPVDDSWKTSQCQKLELSFVNGKASSLVTVSTSKPLVADEKKVVSKNIAGDGNCFLRALSYVITGSEEQHALFRNLLVQFMRKEKERINKFAGEYINDSWRMDMNGTWATDIEIFASAELLGTDIYVYYRPPASSAAPTWQKFSSTALNPLGVPLSEKCDGFGIYLDNRSGNHFNVVANVLE